MARRADLNHLPTTAGEWLRFFRQRLLRKDGLHQIKQLARELGVSSKTIARWEAGHAQPTEFDLDAIAVYLRLSGTQTSFLKRAFARTSANPPSDVTFLRERIRNILCSEFPAILLDDLFNVRASNSNAAALHVGLKWDSVALYQLVPWQPLRIPEEIEGGEERFERMLRNLWIESAGCCGSAAYSRMLEELLEIPNFSERWTRIALQAEDTQLPIGVPELRAAPSIGAYRVFMSRIQFPPTFFLREFIPIDDVARANLNRLWERGRTLVHFHPVLHWTLEDADGAPAAPADGVSQRRREISEPALFWFPGHDRRTPMDASRSN